MKDRPNFILMTDGYKQTHWRQYPPGTEEIYSYLEARTGGLFDHVVFFGLTYYIRKYLTGKVVTRKMVDEAEAFANQYFGTGFHFNRAMWDYIVDVCDGRLPVEIRAVPEGSVVPTGNVLMTVQNLGGPITVPLVGHIETLLMKVWYPSTVATLSWYARRIIEDGLMHTVGNTSAARYMLHDFGYRGVSSEESAGLGAAAHLLSFRGTDTLAGIQLLKEYYMDGVDEDYADPIGVSVPAAEHSTITSWGSERDGELNAYRNMLDAYPTGIVSVVSDSYDLFNAIRNIWGGPLRQQILERDGVLVIRPDSGDILKIVPEVLNAMGETFGYSVNEKGYKVLHPKVQVIQGDGIKFNERTNTIHTLTRAVQKAGWATSNVIMGMGGGLLQDVNRDTLRFAFKASEAIIDGKAVPIQKAPTTDLTKQSKPGRLALVNLDLAKGEITSSYMTANQKYAEVMKFTDVLGVVFHNGKEVHTNSLPYMRSRVEDALTTVNKYAPLFGFYAFHPPYARPDCDCIDCGGNAPGHTPGCEAMAELHGDPFMENAVLEYTQAQARS